MNEAIKLAIEKGGYVLSASKQSLWSKAEIHEDFIDYVAFVIIDPLFWQALGKALGWRKVKPLYDLGEFGNVTEVHYYAHLYFDLVLTGGDTSKFWEDLLK